MEVWDLLRPSFRRILVLVGAGLVAAVAAVNVVHQQADTVKVDASAYFAQALGLDTTSFSVDPTAAQLMSVLSLPEVQQSAARSAKVPLPIVKEATVTHVLGSPVIDISAESTDADQARAAAPALAFAGLVYLAQQSVNHAESVQSTSTVSLTAANAQLAAYRAKTGVANVDTAVANAAAAVAAASTDSETRRAQEQLAGLQALQPQYDVLSSQVTGAQTAVSTGYAAVSAAKSAAAAAELPGNVVSAPAASVSRIAAYLRAAVGAVVVVVVLGMLAFLLIDLRRRKVDERRAARLEATAAGSTRAQEASHVRLAADAPTDVPASDAPVAKPAPSIPIDVPAEPPTSASSEPSPVTDPYQVAALRKLPWSPAVLVPPPDAAAQQRAMDHPVLNASAEASAAEDVRAAGWASDEGSAGNRSPHVGASEVLEGLEQQSDELSPPEEFPSWPGRMDPPFRDASAEAAAAVEAWLSDGGWAGDRSGEEDAAEVLPPSEQQGDDLSSPGEMSSWPYQADHAVRDASADVASEVEDVAADEARVGNEPLEAPLTEPLPFEWAPADQEPAPAEDVEDPRAADAGAGAEPAEFQQVETLDEWDADDDAAARSATAQTYFQP